MDGTPNTLAAFFEDSLSVFPGSLTSFSISRLSAIRLRSMTRKSIDDICSVAMNSRPRCYMLRRQIEPSVHLQSSAPVSNCVLCGVLTDVIRFAIVTFRIKWRHTATRGFARRYANSMSRARANVSDGTTKKAVLLCFSVGFRRNKRGRVFELPGKPVCKF